jgi:hypothetical protein
MMRFAALNPSEADRFHLLPSRHAKLGFAMPAVMPRPRLTLRQPCRESAPVREAKQIARDIGYADDPHMVAFALALIEARDAWENRPQRGRI